MRRMLISAVMGMLALVAPGVANAACAPLPGDRADRLTAIAAGHVDADVAFIGQVVNRLDGVRRQNRTWHGIVFRVVATFAGAPSPRQMLLVGPVCDGDRCVVGSEEEHFPGRGPQLVFANHRHDVGLVPALPCSDAGRLTAAEVDLMLHPSTLPMTGDHRIRWLTVIGAICVVVGLGLVRGCRRYGGASD